MPSMRYFTIFLLQACLLPGCNSRKPEVSSPIDSVSTQSLAPTPNQSSNEVEEANSGNFQNQVFLIGRIEDFLQDKCEVYPECDCCSADLYFLSETLFAFVDRCISGDTYYAGLYEADSAGLKLKFLNEHISEVLDNDYELVKLEEQEDEPSTRTFQIEICNGRIHLIDKSDKYYIHGSRYSTEKEKELLQELGNSEAWQRLKP